LANYRPPYLTNNYWLEFTSCCWNKDIWKWKMNRDLQPFKGDFIPDKKLLEGVGAKIVSWWVPPQSSHMVKPEN